MHPRGPASFLLLLLIVAGFLLVLAGASEGKKEHGPEWDDAAAPKGTLRFREMKSKGNSNSNSGSKSKSKSTTGSKVSGPLFHCNVTLNAERDEIC